MRSLKRREVIALLGCGAGGLALVAAAQPSRKPPAIGFLGADASGWAPWTAAFVQRLAELGWSEGRTVTINYRWSEGHRERDIEAIPGSPPDLRRLAAGCAFAPRCGLVQSECHAAMPEPRYTAAGRMARCVRITQAALAAAE